MAAMTSWENPFDSVGNYGHLYKTQFHWDKSLSPVLLNSAIYIVMEELVSVLHG